MTITYPLNLPVHTGVQSMRFVQRSINALSISPFTGSQQVQAGIGQWFEIDFSLPPMRAADAILWNAFFLKLNGRFGTFLAGDPAYIKRGTETAAVANGALTVRDKILNLRGMTSGKTILAGDYLQIGTGLSAHLHKNLADMTADGSGEGALDIWPSARASFVDGTTITLVDPVGLFRLTSDEMLYEVSEGLIYSGISFGAREAI